VGMDVVREWVSSMSGSVRVQSITGQGCTIELRFPASMSTMQSLVVDLAGQRFALPSVQIEQAVPRGIGHFEMQGDRLVYRHQKRVLSASRLAHLAGFHEADPKPLDQCDAVIVRVDDKMHALAVDGLIDSRELLIKSPGRYARHIRGVAGLSILGNGSVAVNLDLAALLSSEARTTTAPSFPRQAAQAQAKQQLPSVLIVDDSLSVRNSMVQMVEDAGFRAMAARDGLDAVDSIRDFKPDIVLTDLEMPNMNGLELTAYIRSKDDLKELPVIMVTSRSQEKHRRMAQQAGVDAYVTKPYSDTDLLEKIRHALSVTA